MAALRSSRAPPAPQEYDLLSFLLNEGCDDVEDASNPTLVKFSYLSSSHGAPSTAYSAQGICGEALLHERSQSCGGDAARRHPFSAARETGYDADNNGPTVCVAPDVASVRGAIAESMATAITAPGAAARSNSSRSPLRNGDPALNHDFSQAPVDSCNLSQPHFSWNQQPIDRVTPPSMPGSMPPRQGATGDVGASVIDQSDEHCIDDFQQLLSVGPCPGTIADASGTASPAPAIRTPTDTYSNPYTRPSAAPPVQRHSPLSPRFLPYNGVHPARPAPSSAAPPAWSQHRGVPGYRPPSSAGAAAASSATFASGGPHAPSFDTSSSAYHAVPSYSEYSERQHTPQHVMLPNSSPDMQHGQGAAALQAPYALAQGAATAASSTSPPGREAVSGAAAADGPPQPLLAPPPSMASAIVGSRAPYGYGGAWPLPKAFASNGMDAAPMKASMSPSSSGGGAPLERPPLVRTASYHHPPPFPPPHLYTPPQFAHPHYHRLHVPKRYAWTDGYGMPPGFMPYWTVPYPHIPMCRASTWHPGAMVAASPATSSGALVASEVSGRTEVGAERSHVVGVENPAAGAAGAGGVMRTTAPGRRPVHHPYPELLAEAYGESGGAAASHRNPFGRSGALPMMYGSPHVPYPRPSAAVAAAAAGRVLRSASLDSLMMLPSAHELQQATRGQANMAGGIEREVIYEHTTAAEGESPKPPLPPPNLEHTDSFKRRKLSSAWSLPHPSGGGPSLAAGAGAHTTSPTAAGAAPSSRNSTPREGRTHAQPSTAVAPGHVPLPMYDMRLDGPAAVQPSLPSAFHLQARHESPSSSSGVIGAPSGSPETGGAHPLLPPVAAAHFNGGGLGGVQYMGDELAPHLGDLDESFEALGIKLGLDDLDLCMAAAEGEMAAAATTVDTTSGGAVHHQAPPPPPPPLLLQSLSQPQLPSAVWPAQAEDGSGAAAEAASTMSPNGMTPANALDPELAAAAAAASAAAAAADGFFAASDGATAPPASLWASHAAVQSMQLQPPQHHQHHLQVQEQQRVDRETRPGDCVPATPAAADSGTACDAASDAARPQPQQQQQLCVELLTAGDAALLRAAPQLMPAVLLPPPLGDPLPTAPLPPTQQGEEPPAPLAAAAHAGTSAPAPPPAVRPRGSSQRRLNGNSSRTVRTMHPLLQSGAEDKLPGPVRVTVAGGGGGRSGGSGRGSGRGASDGGAASSEDEDAGCGAAGAGVKGGSVLGLFHVKPYLEGRKCIEHGGEMVSRSAFERAGGSMMAKWYRSIKVLPDGLSLGKWLVNNGLPVLKGNPRRSKKTAQPADGDAS